jgi:hypothetical protein
LPKVLTATLIGAALAFGAAPAAADPGPPIDLGKASTCDFIGEQQNSMCLLPFPNDYYTVRDKTSLTGRRVHLQDAAMPHNSAGQPMVAAPYNYNDGFSPGQVTMLKVAGLETPEALRATNPVGLADLGAYKRKRSPVVVIDAKTGKRWPIWVELDSNADTPEQTSLLIHPARNYAAKHRYIVALRDLKTQTGARIPAPAGFRYYRDQLDSGEAVINKRRKHFERIFKTLAEAGVGRDKLYLAWDFTVASDQNIAERELFMRDDAFRQLGDRKLDDLKVKGASPAFAVGSVTELAPCGDDGCQSGEDANVQRRVQGTFTVPCYLEPDCEPGGRFALDAKGLPSRNGTYAAKFDCIIPRVTPDVAGAAAANRPSLYGHGLLGSASEVASTPQKTLAQAHGFVFCATDTIGFSQADIANTVGLLQNLGDFPELTDRVQQGMLNTLYLGRLMLHPQGFGANAAFHVDPNDLESPSTIDPRRLYYNGNSQGGILGGAITAVAPDFTRASLGVPAMNYSVLLQRSVDFDTYAQILDPFYPDPMTQELALTVIQMLWDRSEANGYAHRMTANPLPNTPAHEVLMDVAFGDHQVTTWQADVEARTIGAAAHDPVVYKGRWPGVKPLWGIPRIQKYPYKGSAIVYWDTGPTRTDESSGQVVGTDPPPIENLPNRSGTDPHGAPRAAAAEQQMVSDFLQPDKRSHIANTCKPLACFAGGFLGP